MALAVNIEDLLNKQKIKSNRIEFKKGWNPASIYHSVCAFANDIDDHGGGYIIVGVDTEEDVVITVEPKGITIQNVGGPDRSISSADISRCELLVSKRYRNRRLGEYLKELDMTEGRSTGIPTIQNELKENGSPRAIVVTDEDRTFFRITIPCHEAAGNIIADVAKMDTTQTTTQRIIEMMRANSEITIEELAATCEITRDGVNYHIRNLKRKNKIRRIGGDFGGHWEVIDDK